MLSLGPIPRHVAFIMDGNRRWADAHGYDRQVGHKVGYEKMKQVLQWCMDIGCKVCTVFAFSIENFRRSPDEVSSRTIAPAAMPCHPLLCDTSAGEVFDGLGGGEIQGFDK